MMAVNLEEYREKLADASPEVRDTFDASFSEASRVMSPAGLQNYLEGARGLCELGRGSPLVVSYLQSLPIVVKEVGEDVIQDIISSVMKLSSLVSGEVIELMIASLPTAVRRLGDADLLRGYLSLIQQLASKAPRGLRPMLARLDQLFEKMTLGGLRRWAMWGAQAHARDFEALGKYFSLESADAQAVLKKERRGTLFVDNQRKLNFYLRALWGRDFFIRPTSGDYESREGYRPYIERRVIHVPDAFDDYGTVSGVELYRATTTHAAAHLSYTLEPLSAEALNPAQMMFIGLFEDARIEYLAAKEFPGLKKLWLRIHEQVSEISCAADRVVGLMERVARAMLDESYEDTNPWVHEAAAAFHERVKEDAENSQMSWDLGVTFYNKLAGYMEIPSLRKLESFGIPYRDDNRYLWAFDEQQWHEAEYVPLSQRQERKTVSVMEMVNELDCELAGDDAQEIWRLETPFYLDQEGCTINELEGTEPVSDPFHYQEWDYQVQLNRPDWVTVLERRQKKGDPEEIDKTLIEYRPIASRLKLIIDALQPRGIVRERYQEEGDEIDINAAIRAMIDMRMGQMPDPRINIRYQHKTRDLAVLVLLDLSESTNEVLPDTDRPVIQLAREATAILSWAIDGIGDPFAIHGFASDGRHDVQYYRFKDFGQPYDDEAKARLAGMQGALSTRMGGALRHAAHFLLQQPQQKKLILLVSDGEPADIDVRDPQYLRYDTKKAVEELATRGVTTYCLTLDPHADDYVSRIFGVNRYAVVDHVQKLPEKLPALFVALTS
jgi:hypothetical protein